MISFKFTPAYHRLLVIAGSVFLVTSLYLCSLRLYSITFSPELQTVGSISDASAANVELSDADLPMSYGGYARPPLDGMTLLGAIPPELVPTRANGRRLVIVGDIHGMMGPLDELLRDVDFDEKRDHLVAVGDMVNKGPNSSGVVTRLMQLKASAVRGNHEDRVLLTRDTLSAQSGITADLDSTKMQDRKGQTEDVLTAASLSEEQLDWLAGLPLILKADPLPILIVHAGLVPGIPLEKQDPWAVMNMRTLKYPREELRKKDGEKPRRRSEEEKEAEGGDLEPVSTEGWKPTEPSSTTEGWKPAAPSATESIAETIGHMHGNKEAPESATDDSEISFDRSVVIPLETRKGEHWIEGWNQHQMRLKESDRRVVVYGHDAKVGYVEGKYTYGLDSSCVKGNFLTALIVEAADEGFTTSKAQVKCPEPE